VNDELQLLEVVPEKALNLNRWLGRHEALELVARSCSSADVGCLKQIRDKKLYTEVARNWDSFCHIDLKSSRRKVDTLIRKLDELGPAYFELSRLTYVSPDDFKQLGPAVTSEGVQVDGETIALKPENRDKLQAAVKALRKSRRKSDAAPKSFRSVLDACEALVAQLENPPSEPEPEDKLDLADVMLRMRDACAGLGVFWR